MAVPSKTAIIADNHCHQLMQASPITNIAKYTHTSTDSSSWQRFVNHLLELYLDHDPATASHTQTLTSNSRMVVIFLCGEVGLSYYRSVTHPVSVISRSVVREASISSTVLIVASGLLVVKIFDSCPSQLFMKVFQNTQRSRRRN